MADFYVDFSAPNHGDGSDGAQAAAPAGAGAWNVFTATEIGALTVGDVVWFRRTGSANKKVVTFPAGTGPTPGEKYHLLGWPLDANDDHYAQAQATANTVKATWDGDLDTFTYISPVAAVWAPQYLRVARMFAEELGAAANNFLSHQTGTPRDFTFYKCKVSRNTAQMPPIGPNYTAQGVMEYNDIHVKGTTPNSIYPSGGSYSSVLIRVRVELTDVGSSRLSVAPSSNTAFAVVFEILEWIDSGTHWLYFYRGLGGSSGGVMFTTDDDVVGQIPVEVDGNYSLLFGNCNGIIRNVTFDHALASANANPVQSPAINYSHHYENLTFHPTDHTVQVKVSSGGKLTGRNIKNFDAVKVDNTGSTSNGYDAYYTFMHFAQLNGGEGWYRAENGSIAQISSVYRTGGAANAIMVEPTDRIIQMQQRGHCTGIFRSEFKGIEAFAFVRTGLAYPVTQKVTAYFAVLNWDNIEDKDRIWFEIELYKNGVAGDYTRRLIDSRKLPNSQSFIPDLSVWNGLLSPNTYRVEIPVTIEKDDIVKVRFFVRDTHLSTGLQRNIVVFDPAVTLA